MLMASDLRRQKRKAIRESKANKTSTKIEAHLAVKLEQYMLNEHYFKKQIELCEELGLEYPKNAKTGAELPLFNKNPITNEIEIHSESVDLFTAFQVEESLIDSLIGLQDVEGEDYQLTIVLISAIHEDPSFALYLRDLAITGESKEKSLLEMLHLRYEEVLDKLERIFISEQ